MRLVFLYYSRGCRSHTNWDPNMVAKSPLIHHYRTDGYAHVGARLIEDGVVDEVLAFVETGRYFGHFDISNKHRIYAIPYITCVEPLLKDGDVLFVRGAWRHWAEPLSRWCQRHQIMYYGAGTPRNNWPYWHIVFNDFIDKPLIKHGKQYYPFIKPINSQIFYPRTEEKKYDISLTSGFHLYDKKGQYLAVAAAVEYRKLYKKSLKIVLPGGLYRNTHTSHIDEVIRSNNLDIYRSGIVDRSMIATFANQSKLAVHLGYGDFVSRSILEALACNLPIYIATPRQWPTWVSSKPNVCSICSARDKPEVVAQEIHELLTKIENGSWGMGAAAHFEQYGSVEKTVEVFKKVLCSMREAKFEKELS